MTAVTRFRSVVLDCPDARALARFYAGVVGGHVQDDDPMGVPPLERSREWGRVVLDVPGGPRLCFQRAEGYTPPEWPRADRNSQQFHLDFDAGSTWEEIEEAEKKVLALGARPLHAADKEDFRVYADPAGHPFCLCRIDPRRRLPVQL